MTYRFPDLCALASAVAALLEYFSYLSLNLLAFLEALEKAWAKNDLVSLIVETDGVKSYLEKLGKQAYFIYLTVSDFSVLKKRLLGRGDKASEIDKRLNSFEFKRDLHLSDELAKKAHVLNNDNWEKTAKELDKIVKKLENK